MPTLTHIIHPNTEPVSPPAPATRQHTSPAPKPAAQPAPKPASQLPATSLAARPALAVYPTQPDTAPDLSALLVDWQAAMNQAHQALASADATCRMLRQAIGKDVPREPVEWGFGRPFKLTRAELEVLRLMTHGHSNRAIAHRLVITERTIKGHVSNIMGKLGVESRTQAVLYALQHSLVVDNGVQHVA